MRQSMRGVAQTLRHKPVGMMRPAGIGHWQIGVLQVLKPPLRQWGSVGYSTANIVESARAGLKAFPSGIKLLYSPDHGRPVVADIVFVHGLTGDREKTWTARDVPEPWPKTLLPAELPNVRVLTFGYDAFVARWGWGSRVSQNRIGSHASNLLASLTTFRDKGDENRPPIIFVCHSLGGIVCMDALVKSRNPSDSHLMDIFRSTRGIAFLGTPHRGAGLAQPAGWLAWLIGVLRQTNTDVLGALRVDSEVLDRIRYEFHTMMRAPSRQRSQPIDIACFYEELAPKGTSKPVVPEWSATLRGHSSTGIYADHMNMTKFASKEDPGFTLVSGQLQRWVREIEATVTTKRPLMASGSSASRATVGATPRHAMTAVRRDSAHRRPPNSEFRVAIICALPVEAEAIAAHFDQRLDEGLPYPKADGDRNAYTCGIMGGHFVVVVHPPGAGKVRATDAVNDCKRSFPKINLAIVAGVCGAVPFISAPGGVKQEIVLGDVIISTSVIQHDLGRLKFDGFKMKDGLKDALGPPPESISSLLAKLRTDAGLKETMMRHMDEDRLTAIYPGVGEDMLFEETYDHANENATCSTSCDTSMLIPRRRLEQQAQRPRPEIHFGAVASGDTVMMLGTQRDKLSKKLQVVAFEMEGAGVWRNLPCLVIKGASDYADSHKLKSFQPYAAATAAACTRAILDYWAATRSATGPWFVTPYRENEHFSGREEILKKLQSEFDPDKFQEGRFHRRVALHGRPGVGKTQIALAYANWLWQHPKAKASIFWVHASNAQRFRQAFTEIAEICRIPGYYEDPTADVLLLVKRWLESEASGQWLMIMDNADDAELFYPSGPGTKNRGSAPNPSGEENVGDYLPNCAHGAILITTGDREVGIDLTESSGIEVQKMTPDESLKLLRKRLKDESRSSDGDLRSLAIRLGCLPFTLVQAAAYIQRNRMRIGELLSYLNEEGSQGGHALKRVLGEEVNTHGRDPTASKETVEMFQRSFKHIQHRNPFAADLLSLMSLFDRQDIPRDLLSIYSKKRREYRRGGEVALRGALGVLMQWGHIQEDQDREYDVHRIEQALTQAWLEDRGEKPKFERDAIIVMLLAVPFNSHEDPAKYSRYLPHIQAVVELRGTGSDGEQLAKAVLLDRAAMLLSHQDQGKDAEKCLEKAKIIRQEVLRRGVRETDFEGLVEALVLEDHGVQSMTRKRD